MSDIKIHITDRDGTTHDIEAPTDMNMNLMEVVRYVESDHKLPERSDDEEAMLAEAFNVKESSRLGCQIHMYPELDGLKVTLAPEE